MGSNTAGTSDIAGAKDTAAAEATAKSSTGPRRWVVAWGVLALWVIVLAVAGAFAGRLGDVQRDQTADYLPAGADSTQVAALQEKLPGGEITALVLVYHRDGGLTAADRATAARQLSAITVAPGVQAAKSPAELGDAKDPKEFAAVQHGPAVTSKDGATLAYTLTTAAPAKNDDARKAFVDDVRQRATDTDGMSVRVGGDGALDVDARGVFGSLDTTLMLATGLVVALLLILTYRSPVLWLVPLLAVGAGAVCARAAVYGLATVFDTTVTSQSAGIMTVLVFGAGTDYALLLVARYRDELRRTPLPYDAMRAALRGCGPALFASSGTVVAGLLCLLAADLNNIRGLGPVGAVGVVCALAAMLTLLPALLVLLGRRVFWPLIPEYGSEPAARRRNLFAAMGSSTAKRPTTVLLTGVVLLGALALGAFNLPGALKQEDSFTSKPESTLAMGTLSTAFPDRGSRPLQVMTPTGRADRTLADARLVDGVAGAERGRSGGGWTEIAVTATAAPESAAESATIGRLRQRLTGAHVGGASAQALDLADTNAHDRLTVIPLVLISVLLVLALLLRSLIAPLLLVAAVAAVWGAALGIGGLVFGPVLGFHGLDPGLPLLTFVFLVALGVDYGIFLMHRTREEALRGAGPQEAALTALRTTGGVIASAGTVLAATFAVLASLPLVMFVELGTVIAVGVLLDTFLVRTYLVTGANLLLGRAVWWPGRLSRAPRTAEAPPALVSAAP
ncbi:Acyltrehalose exporter MmpL10 [Streptomyces hundungensis]|uniref:Acyltrehalose exporter MmpL10 n=1 Tax=Streptomyces hundungensis TaxID=1077946 RepID=A0A387HJZ8_9ACTN|nr:MMPL family transporter [Streptomyces hundungensis]AYG83031.1 Acyltrehalose exporter MmpL10 [Streptomyces hundungensis]